MPQKEIQEQLDDKQRTHVHVFPEGKSRLIDIHEVCFRTGFGKSTVFAKVADKTFVQPVKVKRGVTRWLESEIDDWIASVVEASK